MKYYLFAFLLALTVGCKTTGNINEVVILQVTSDGKQEFPDYYFFDAAKHAPESYIRRMVVKHYKCSFDRKINKDSVSIIFRFNIGDSTLKKDLENNTYNVQTKCKQ